MNNNTATGSATGSATKKAGRPKVYTNGSKMITVMIPTDGLPEFRAYLAELRKKYSKGK